ncbi:MAG: DUF4358 domain-containing protein [Ruminococcaceae bacterium]|nr:DUF4358 domain-containing protein [Oscillospiraceae bacterium]
MYMRRLVGLLCVLLLAFSVVGCSSSADVDLNKVLDDINAQFDAQDLKVLEDASDLERYYMITEDMVEQFAVEFSTQSSVFTEVVLVEAVDDAAAAEVATLLNNHYQSRLSEAKSYNPESVAMLESCSVEQNGTYVSLIIGDDATQMKEIYNSYFE